MFDVLVGHFLSVLTFTLGPIASLSATLANQHPITEIVGPLPDCQKLDGETIPQTGPTQVAVTGTLRDSGAVLAVHFRGGLPTAAQGGKAGTPFLWTIDGDKGSIKLECDTATGAFISVSTNNPTLYLNGEEVSIEARSSFPGESNEGRAWFAFAERDGASNYSTLDDAVRLKRVMNAISMSAAEGRRVDL